jgi:RimJ/RimL family protein N-acetyltransferase
VQAPVIETERLRLRSFCEQDWNAWAATLGDPEVVRFLGGTPFSAEDSWRRVLTAAGAWSLLGYGYWAVERKEDGLLVGQAGFADFKRDMTPSIAGLPEMGWIFTPAGQGKGYATEAGLAALAWADEALAGAEIPAIIDPDNLPSIRVAERLGFNSREDATYKGAPILLFRRRSPTASASAASTAA